MRLRWGFGFVCVVGLVLAPALPAWGHGDLQSSDPAADSVVRKAPKSVSITLSEGPGPGTQVRVADGCNRSLVVDQDRSGETITLGLKKGEPGTWDVRYKAISAVDGHTSRGTFAFKVKGKRDCSRPKPDTDIDGGEDTIIRSEDQTDGGFPIVPFALGSLAIIGIALVLRRAQSR
ncbi:MAG TPA: copper resistance CopC family protein [Actinomycetota bacterium]|nr:copper resistance CopC family protein [Actinomycetota bacterium]